MTLHGGFRVYGATFFIFSDYCRPSVRLSAIMGLPVTYVFTHDSFYVGEDGPTHEPIEHLASFRQPGSHLLERTVLLYRRLQIAQGFGGLLVFFVVVNDLGQHELRLQLFKTLLHLFQTINHGPSPPPGFEILDWKCGKTGIGGGRR